MRKGGELAFDVLHARCGRNFNFGCPVKPFVLGFVWYILSLSPFAVEELNHVWYQMLSPL